MFPKYSSKNIDARAGAFGRQKSNMPAHSKALGTAFGVAAGIAVTGLYLWDQYREADQRRLRRELLAEAAAGSELYAKGSERGGPSDEQLSEEVRKYMQLSLENMMVLFKRERPGASFEAFISARFPENSFVGPNGQLSCDERVRCPSWEGAYQRVLATDALHDIGGAPPGGKVS
jgi:hypothetical protein